MTLTVPGDGPEGCSVHLERRPTSRPDGEAGASTGAECTGLLEHRSAAAAQPAGRIVGRRCIEAEVNSIEARAPARSRLSYGRRGWGSTTTSHRQREGLMGSRLVGGQEGAGSTPATLTTGVSSNGRAAVLQTADGGSIPSAPTRLVLAEASGEAGRLSTG
jgi:hypothetical protein